MKLVPPPKPPTAAEDGLPPLSREVALDDIFMHLETHRDTTIVFVDGAAYCRDYLTANPWIGVVASIIEVDQDIMDFFKVTRVPMWVWFRNGSEEDRLMGTTSQDELVERRKRKHEGNGHE